MRYLLLCLLTISLYQTTIAQCKKKFIDKEIVGYYASWQYYDRQKVARPENVDFRRFTTIIYAFFKPTEEGKLVGGDAFVDETILKGEINWAISTNQEHYYFETTSLPYLAHLKRTKVLISIGGWSYSKNFSIIVHDSIKRKTFARECIRLIKEYKIDGIDIDWEFPGYGGQGGRPSDKENFTLLIDEVKNALDSLGKKKRKNYILSVTLNAAPPHHQYIEWQNINSSVDMLNLMCYDFYGSWVHTTTHKAALYPHPDPYSKDKINNVDTLFRLITSSGLSPNKINIGCAFDGRTAGYKRNKPLYSGATFANHYIPKSHGQPSYYAFQYLIDSLEYHYDSIAEAPYLVDTVKNIFITYEDERSLLAKTKFVNNNDAQGIFIWDISGDMLESKPNSGIIKETPLLYAIHEGFCRKEEIKQLRKEKKRKRKSH